MRILLTGSEGQLGTCLKERLPVEWELLACNSQTLNIIEAQKVLNIVKNFAPDLVINAAAYTQVDAAETEIKQAFAVNATGTFNLAAAARTIGARLIHVSTEQVFDGRQRVPINENMAPNPLNVYGQSKLAGELLALNAHTNTTIVRTSWVYSEHRRNFVKIMLKKGLETQNIRVVDDQIGCPTYAGDLAQTIIQLAKKKQPQRGLLHFAGNQKMSWATFAQQIFAFAAQQDKRYRKVMVEPICSADYQSAAKRPKYGILDCSTIHKLVEERFVYTPLAEVISRLLAK